MKIFIIIFISLFITKGYANNMEISGIDISQFNEGFKPQDSFYDYVNHNWLSETEIPDDQIGWGSYMTLREESLQNQNTLINALIKNKDNLVKSSEEEKIANLYLSYTNRNLVNKLGSAPLKDDIKRINNISTTEDLWKYFSESVKKGISSPIYFAVYDDLKDPLNYTIYFGQSGLGLPDRDYYLLDQPHYIKGREEYPKHLSNLFDLSGLDNANKRASNAFDVEKELAKIQISRTERRDPEKTYNPMNGVDLDEISDAKFNIWLKNLAIEYFDRYIIESPDYLADLSNLIDEYPLDKWKDYLLARLVKSASGSLSDDFVDESYRFSSILTGREEMPALWKRSVGFVNGLLGDALGKIYVKHHFPPEYKQRMVELIDNLLESFRIGIEDLEWMSKETKEKALIKLEKLNVKIGYPEVWKDYTGLNFSDDDLYGNIKAASEFGYKEALKKLSEKVDRKRWAMSPQTVNAYFSPTKNEIVFPAAYLQPPNFFPDADDAVNYGAIGITIGHEISHAFDDKGSQFDGDGNLNNWWTEEDREIFEKKTKRLVDQYSSYEITPGNFLNGDFTLGENIADLAGAIASFRAYKISLNGKSSPVIDGLTGEQRFFFGSAQADRVKFRKEIDAMRVATDPHSPSRYRIDGVFVNMPSFHEAFETQEGDKMFRNKDEIIKIW
tara:strand:+ start:1670 stop:3682 length:2013 start_codon:yes stop_codon:yes gene_type:complete